MENYNIIFEHIIRWGGAYYVNHRYPYEIYEDLKSQFKEDIAALRGELKGDIAELRGELKEDINKVRTELANAKAEIIKWLFIFLVGQGATIISILKFINK